MNSIIELPDDKGIYSAIQDPTASRSQVRVNINRLGQTLAREIHILSGRRAIERESLLCVIILRGGALLYPSFAAEFTAADFCMLGMRRINGGVVCDYSTGVPRDAYDRVVYVDCIAGTGGTLLEARRVISEMSHRGTEVAAVVCSAATATSACRDAGIGMIGFSLYETETAGIVAPDLGKLDAGDLFTSPGRRSVHAP